MRSALRSFSLIHNPAPSHIPTALGYASASHGNSFLGRFYSLFRTTQFNACDTPSRSRPLYWIESFYSKDGTAKVAQISSYRSVAH
ncbi:hypothetical protein CY34DRAFT_807827 [Suillus luteus UH-Slu-Lm8-n1]|uniref:Uncharacterized protein n=1 Tax=Suillus luteus UH-Slu-Lm8-n1 TaxID=930992 RepID=A0A0D0B7N4_9AGAM|nr:hypothetical protein CY34DRAFT_807827 [Suillus luteus UH-Slu-Lm8-n1]